jgi:hypothetical protein
MLSQIILSAFEGWCGSTGPRRLKFPPSFPPKKGPDPDDPPYGPYIQIGLSMVGGILGYYVAISLGFDDKVSQFAISFGMGKLLSSLEF